MNRVDRIRNLSSRRFLRNLDTDDKNIINNNVSITTNNIINTKNIINYINYINYLSILFIIFLFNSEIKR